MAFINVLRPLRKRLVVVSCLIIASAATITCSSQEDSILCESDKDCASDELCHMITGTCAPKSAFYESDKDYYLAGSFTCPVITYEEEENDFVFDKRTAWSKSYLRGKFGTTAEQQVKKWVLEGIIPEVMLGETVELDQTESTDGELTADESYKAGESLDEGDDWDDESYDDEDWEQEQFEESVLSDGEDRDVRVFFQSKCYYIEGQLMFIQYLPGSELELSVLMNLKEAGKKFVFPRIWSMFGIRQVNAFREGSDVSLGLGVVDKGILAVSELVERVGSEFKPVTGTIDDEANQGKQLFIKGNISGELVPYSGLGGAGDTCTSPSECGRTNMNYCIGGLCTGQCRYTSECVDERGNAECTDRYEVPDKDLKDFVEYGEDNLIDNATIDYESIDQLWVDEGMGYCRRICESDSDCEEGSKCVLKLASRDANLFDILESAADDEEATSLMIEYENDPDSFVLPEIVKTCSTPAFDAVIDNYDEYSGDDYTGDDEFDYDYEDDGYYDEDGNLTDEDDEDGWWDYEEDDYNWEEDEEYSDDWEDYYDDDDDLVDDDDDLVDDDDDVTDDDDDVTDDDDDLVDDDDDLVDDDDDAGVK